MTATLSITLSEPLTIDGVPVRCPGGDGAPAPRRLKLLVTDKAVMASCGKKHRTFTGGKWSAKAECFFALQGILPGTVRMLDQQSSPNRRFRVTMPDGKVMEGRRGPAAAASPAKKGTAAETFAAKKAAAAQGGARVGRRQGGTLAAALGMVTAVAGSATATANAVGATANAVGKGFDMGREGLRTGQAAIKAADNAGARSFARENRSSDSSDDAE
ncbi:hypothetical protein P1P68_02280 [Streptomyces scabiei]|uniref:hypothetical protein n=1 Tax=Streptomyces scabiei TaxID=1930 RepID=UPI00298F9BCA|nr:hypothetical protein [Streptomyces scabiei]MDW8803662.1 hypothetical protein [Streptomyces scabiei]